MTKTVYDLTSKDVSPSILVMMHRGNLRIIWVFNFYIFGCIITVPIPTYSTNDLQQCDIAVYQLLFNNGFTQVDVPVFTNPTSFGPKYIIHPLLLQLRNSTLHAFIMVTKELMPPSIHSKSSH